VAGRSNRVALRDGWGIAVGGCSVFDREYEDHAHVQMVLQLPREHRLQSLSSALMQQLAPLDQQRVVCDFLSQRMLENVLNFGKRRLS
jgi:hypothetical protein